MILFEHVYLAAARAAEPRRTLPRPQARARLPSGTLLGTTARSSTSFRLRPLVCQTDLLMIKTISTPTMRMPAGHFCTVLDGNQALTTEVLHNNILNRSFGQQHSDSQNCYDKHNCQTDKNMSCQLDCVAPSGDRRFFSSNWTTPISSWPPGRVIPAVASCLFTGRNMDENRTSH